MDRKPELEQKYNTEVTETDLSEQPEVTLDGRTTQKVISADGSNVEIVALADDEKYPKGVEYMPDGTPVYTVSIGENYSLGSKNRPLVGVVVARDEEGNIVAYKGLRSGEHVSDDVMRRRFGDGFSFSATVGPEGHDLSLSGVGLVLRQEAEVVPEADLAPEAEPEVVPEPDEVNEDDAEVMSDEEKEELGEEAVESIEIQELLDELESMKRYEEALRAAITEVQLPIDQLNMLQNRIREGMDATQLLMRAEAAVHSVGVVVADLGTRFGSLPSSVRAKMPIDQGIDVPSVLRSLNFKIQNRDLAGIVEGREVALLTEYSDFQRMRLGALVVIRDGLSSQIYEMSKKTNDPVTKGRLDSLNY